jgi:hypothetical protein
MARRVSASADQLGFDDLLMRSDADNRKRTEREAHAHLPGTMDEALPYFRALLGRHHAAMVVGDLDAVNRLRGDAHDLAYKLNNYEPGILADENAPGYLLARLTQAEAGQVPLWGQTGSFEMVHKGMRVRIEMQGLLGICSSAAWLGFAAHAVEKNKPFLSETGYRSFLGVGGTLRPGYTPDIFSAAIIEAYVARELKGKLRRIVPLRRA